MTTTVPEQAEFTAHHRPESACPPPGYSIVRTDELEAAITAYLANDDKGLRGAMADLCATREMGTLAWRVDFWTDRPVSELIAEAGAEPVENPADLEIQGISDESWAALGQAPRPEQSLDALRALSDAAAPGPWQWLNGGDEHSDELQDGDGEEIARGFREDIELTLNRDGSFAAAAANYVRSLLREAKP